MPLAQPRQQRHQVLITLVLGRVDLIPGQGVGQAAFADRFLVHQRRHGDVRHDAHVLVAGTGHPVELGVGHLELAVVQVQQGLHGAFAVGLIADDQGAAVVLHGAGENLRRRGAVAVDQHRQRPGIEHAGILIVFHADATAGLAHLHGGATVDEQADQFVHLQQGTAAVVAQVHHQAVDILFTQFHQQFRHVPGGAGVIRIATVEGVEIHIEGGNLDDAQLHGVAAVLHLDHFLLGGLFLQHHLVAGNRDGAGVVLAGAAGGNHFQAHLGALRPANLVDHFVQAHADDVDHLLVALGHSDHPVGGAQLPLFGGRAAGHQAHHLGVAVLVLQHRADAFQRTAHADVEVLGIMRREIVGVRIKGLGEGVHVGLEHVLGGVLTNPAELAFIAVGQPFADFLVAGAVEAHGQHRVAQLAAPDRVQGVLVLGPVRFAAVHQHLAVTVEVPVLEAAFQGGEDLGEAVFQTALEAVEDGVTGLQDAVAQLVVELIAVGLEVVHVLLGEIQPVGVKILQILLKHLRGKRVVELQAPVVQLQALDDFLGGFTVDLLGLERSFDGGVVAQVAAHFQGAAQQQGRQEHAKQLAEYGHELTRLHFLKGSRAV